MQFYIEHSQRKHWTSLDYERAAAEKERRQARLTDFAWSDPTAFRPCVVQRNGVPLSLVRHPQERG